MSLIRNGYLDALDGLPFPKRYDDLSVTNQMRYEFGRLAAANIKAASIQPPDWPAHYSGMPPAVRRAHIHAIAMIGTPLPMRRQRLFAVSAVF